MPMEIGRQSLLTSTLKTPQMEGEIFWASVNTASVSSRLPCTRYTFEDLEARRCADAEEASRVSARIRKSASWSMSDWIRAPPCLPVAPETRMARDIVVPVMLRQLGEGVSEMLQDELW